MAASCNRLISGGNSFSGGLDDVCLGKNAGAKGAAFLDNLNFGFVAEETDEALEILDAFAALNAAVELEPTAGLEAMASDAVPFETALSRPLRVNGGKLDPAELLSSGT